MMANPPPIPPPIAALDIVVGLEGEVLLEETDDGRDDDGSTVEDGVGVADDKDWLAQWVKVLLFCCICCNWAVDLVYE
jgi:hypothetical protein